MKLVKEAMDPMLGPDMKHNDDFISQHEEGDHKHHSTHYGKHKADHKVHSDHIKSEFKGK
jgi:hypothetical protein